MRKLFVVLGVMAICLVADVFIAQIIEPDAGSPRQAVQKVGAKTLAYILAKTMKLRMTLPKKVDDITQLEDIHADENMVIYSMSTTTDGAAFDRMMAEIRKHSRETSCSRADYRKMIKFGLVVVINFRSPSGKQDIPVMVTPKMCGVEE